MADGTAKPAEPALASPMSLCALVAYGFGDMLGSGVCARVGKAAGLMGSAVWFAVVVSRAAALLTALSCALPGPRFWPRA